MKKILLAMGLAVTVLLTGCGGVSSQNVIAEPVSGYKYNKMSCSELESEMDFLQAKARKAAGVVDSVKATQDGKGAAAFLFCWVCGAFIDDNSKQATQLAEIKGQFEAASRVYERKCNK